MRFTIYVAAGIISAAIVIAWGVSAAANFYTGASLGTDAPFMIFGFETSTSALFSLASVSADLLKALCLFLVFMACANRQFGQAAALFTIWALCAFWSFNSAIGFVAMNHSTVTDNRGKTADSWSELKKEIKRKEERRNWIPEHRPSETVKAEIIGKEGMYLFTRSASCSDVTAKESITFCNDLAKLRREFANAEAASKLDGELDSLRAELKGSDKVSSADPYADLVAGITGASSNQATSGRALFFAVMIEVISALGMSAVWQTVLRKRVAGSGAATASPATRAPAALSSPVLPRTERAELPVRIDLSRKAVLSTPETTEPPPPPPADAAPSNIHNPNNAPVEAAPAKLALVDENWVPTPKHKGKPAKLAKFADIDAPTRAWLNIGSAIPVALSLGSSGSAVWNDYNEFCLSQHPPVKPLNPSHLGRSLRRVGVASMKTARGAKYALRLVKMPVRRAA